MKIINKRIGSIFLVCLMFLASSLDVWALDASEYEVDTVNTLKMGSVSISIKEYQLDENEKKIPWKNQRNVLPGQMIDKIVRIANNANPVWIRVKIEFTSKDGIAYLEDEMISIAVSGWEKIGDYYYYKEPVKKGGYVDFIDEVMIPPEWDDGYATKKFSLIISAEAVQEVNFTPDFKREDPWFGTVIETSLRSKYDSTHVAQENFQIIFMNGSEGLIKLGTDFFSNFGQLMPGDVKTGDVKIENRYSQPVDIYFRSEIIDDKELLGLVRLEIKNDEKTIYAGILNSSSQTNDIFLGNFEQEEASNLQYTVTIPEGLGNRYALEEAKVKWVFTAKLTKEEGILHIFFPKTGDTFMGAGFYAACVIISGLGVVYLVKRRKGGKEIE